MPATIDAAALCKMAERGRSRAACSTARSRSTTRSARRRREIKGIDSEVAGDPDILLVPDLEAGNMLAKQLTFLANADSAGLRARRARADHPDEPRRQRALADRELRGRDARGARAPARGVGGTQRGLPMDDYVLVLNAGSSSLKFCVYGRDAKGWRDRGARPDRGHRHRAAASARRTARGRRSSTRSSARTSATRARRSARSPPGSASAIRRRALVGVGHRVVHGGARYAAPALVTPRCSRTCAR